MTTLPGGSESIVTNGMWDAVSLSGGAGGDEFNVIEVSFDLTLGGGLASDTFTLGSQAPLFTGNVDGITGNVAVNGGDGFNRLIIINTTGDPSNVIVTSELITGLTENPIAYNGRFDRTDGEIGGIQIVGSNNGGDTFDVQSLKAGDSIRVHGMNGNDIFDIGNDIAGDAQFDGGNGSDTYNFVFGASTPRNIAIADTGTSGADTLNLAGSDGDDDIVLDSDSVSDAFTNLTFNIPLDDIEIFGNAGNDTFTINGAPLAVVTLRGNDGFDSFVVNGTANIEDLNLFGGGQADTFQFNATSGTTRIDADGVNGDDSFMVGAGVLGNLFLDGNEGSDSYEVQLGATVARRIDTRDTGEEGSDTTSVIGTATNERIAIRTTRFLHNDEIIIFDENTEGVSADSAGGNDRIVIFGSRSPLTEVFAGAGNDVFVVNGGSRADLINLHGQDGNDNFNVFKTSAGTTNNLFGDEGDDRFNIGSTINADNGNLGLIRGELNIFGGANTADGEDQLIANDSSGGAAYSYRVTPNSITPIAGPANLPRENFIGINYDASTEFLRLDGTEFANLFEVTASPATRYFFDGNAPTTGTADRLAVVFQPNDGRDLNITNASAGDGFVTFTNGNEIVQFEDIELPSLGTSGGVGSLVLPPGFDGDIDDFFSSLDLDELDELDGFAFPV